MSGAFQYRPKFVDIRVRPPKPEEEGQREEDVLRLKPGEKVCDWPECGRAGASRAPKSREAMHDHYWFCQAHAAEYNKSWDFFAGMSEGQIRAHQEASALGDRPTWSFKADSRSREAAAFAAKMGTANAKPGWDPFGLFGRGGRSGAAPETPGRALGKLERQALADLDLEDGADKAKIRARYKDLLKRCHPDANGGDRSAEHKLQRVIKAYKTLQKSGMA